LYLDLKLHKLKALAHLLVSFLIDCQNGHMTAQARVCVKNQYRLHLKNDKLAEYFQIFRGTSNWELTYFFEILLELYTW